MTIKNRTWFNVRDRRRFIDKPKKRIVPIGEGFTGVDRESALAEFLSSPENVTLWERLQETVERLPWLRELIGSLMSRIESDLSLTDKQRSLATSLYIDSCAITDERVEQQVATRKLGYRLMSLELGRARKFVTDVMYRSDVSSLSLGQMRAMKDIADKLKLKLKEVPELSKGNFDGWFKIS